MSGANLEGLVSRVAQCDVAPDEHFPVEALEWPVSVLDTVGSAIQPAMQK